MKKEYRLAIEEYQCSGCISGCNISCFGENEMGGIGCGEHYAGTMVLGIGNFFLGMPKGFNRIGIQKTLKPNIYDTFESSEWEYDMWNIPAWKYLSKNGHTFIRGMMPRKNEPFLHIFLEDCMNKIDCLEISQADIDGMD